MGKRSKGKGDLSVGLTTQRLSVACWLSSCVVTCWLLLHAGRCRRGRRLEADDDGGLTWESQLAYLVDSRGQHDSFTLNRLRQAFQMPHLFDHTATRFFFC